MISFCLNSFFSGIEISALLCLCVAVDSRTGFLAGDPGSIPGEGLEFLTSEAQSSTYVVVANNFRYYATF